MHLSLYPYQLEFIFPFKIAHGMRTHTPAVFITLEHNGIVAYGEATLPPYLPYTQQSTMAYLQAIDLSQINDPLDASAIIAHIKSGSTDSQPPALAALDMALWLLRAQHEHTTISQLLHIDAQHQPPRTFTIGICNREEMEERINYGLSKGFTLFKLKLDGKNDKQLLEDYKSLSNAPFAVDVNQAWTHIDYAVEIATTLQSMGCVLIEQPFDKDDRTMTIALRSHISIPIIADEACQTIEDIPKLIGIYDGINVKLQKCGGISAAEQMIQHAKVFHMKVLIGCMSESSIGCLAAESLAPLCDWNDLDGVALVKEPIIDRRQ